MEYGKKRWKIENEGFNTQKRQGYCLEHLFSKDYQAIKNHYYLIQIGHMIAQVMENMERIWRDIKLSREQKHRRMLESFKKELIVESEAGLEVRMQMRLI